MRFRNIKSDIGPSAIVTGCTTLVYLIRSLGKNGVPVIALHSQKRDYGICSRYVRRRARAPQLRTAPEKYLSFLKSRGQMWQDSVLIPHNDDALELLSKNRALLTENYRICAMDWSVVERLLDKKQTYELAGELGIPFPRSHYPRHASDLRDISRGLGFPCIVKPFLTHRFFPVFRSKLLVAKDYQQLERIFNRVCQNELDVMISEIVPGPDENIVELSFHRGEDGEGTSKSTRFRQCPGRSKYRDDSLAENENSKDFGCRLIHSLMARCGMNLPMQMYDDMVGRRTQSHKTYRKGVFWIDTISDVQCAIFRKEPYRVWEYLNPYVRKKAFAVMAIDDPLPYYRLTLQFLSRLWRAVRKTKRT